MDPLNDAVDHVRGSTAGRLILEYGDYEYPYSQQAFREIDLQRIRREVESGIAPGEVSGTPTLFIDGVVHRGGYDTAMLLEALDG